MGTCAFMAYFFLAGYQFCQAQAVVKKLVSLTAYHIMGNYVTYCDFTHEYQNN